MDLRETREATVREHMESENRHDFDVTLATFHHPRYEIVPTGDVYDGPEEVARYFSESRAAFPDQRNRLIALHHAEDAVVAEFDLLGTHQGALHGVPPVVAINACNFRLLGSSGHGDQSPLPRLRLSATLRR